MSKLTRTSKRSSQSFQNIFENFVKNDANKSGDNLLAKFLKTTKSDEPSKKTTKKSVVNHNNNVCDKQIKQTDDISNEDNIYLRFVQKSDEKVPENKRKGRNPKRQLVSQPSISDIPNKREKSARICAKTIATDSKTVLKSQKIETNDSKVKKPNNRRKSCVKLDFKTIDITNDINIEAIESVEPTVEPKTTVCEVINDQKVDEKVSNVEIVTEKVKEEVEKLIEKEVEEVIEKEVNKKVDELIEKEVNKEKDSQKIKSEIKSSQKPKISQKSRNKKTVEKTDESTAIEDNTQSIRRSTRVRKATNLYTGEVTNKISKQKPIKDNQKPTDVDESDVETKSPDKTVKNSSKRKPKSKSKSIQKSTKSKKTVGRKGIGKLLNDFRNRNKAPEDYLKRLKYVEKDPTIDVLHKKLGLVSTRLSAIPESNEEF